MENRNVFSEKFKDKSTSELQAILESDSHVDDAKLAAKWILEERNPSSDNANIAFQAEQYIKDKNRIDKESSEVLVEEYTGKKLYTEKQVSASAFLGGPLPAGILIYKNLIRLGKEKEAYVTLATTLILSVGLVFALIRTPENIIDKIPNQLFPAIWGLLILAIYHVLFAHLAKKELKSKGAIESNWNVAGITVFGTILFLAVAIIIAMFEPDFPGKKMEFKGGNVIYHNETSSAKDIGNLSSQLFAVQFFDEKYPGTARLETYSNSYTVTLLFNKDLWEDQNVNSELTSLKWLLEAAYNSSVNLKLMDYSLNGDEVYKIIDQN